MPEEVKFKKPKPNFQAILNKQKEMEADEKFLASIEEQIGIKGSAKNNFRADITSYMFAKLRRGEVIDWRSKGPIR